MARGGYRENAGRKYKWQLGPTRTIRVPIAIADKVMEIAQGLDRGTLIFDQSVLKENTHSRTLRLVQELRVYQEGGKEVIQLSDFMRLMQALAKAAK